MTDQKKLEQLQAMVSSLYGDHYDKERWELLVHRFEERLGTGAEPISERNVALITYGDGILDGDKTPLAVLHEFLKEEAGDSITDIHILPMFPYTSDDGFSVTDYLQINPSLGSWKEIAGLKKDYRLMFDFVANHISKESGWFTGYLGGEQTYADYFIPREEAFDVSQVVRPRISPLFHTYEGSLGEVCVWTTFSEDQVDLNYGSFSVFLNMTDILLTYVERGAASIRLDAIGFLWKESGTSCMHLRQTHEVIQVWHLLLQALGCSVSIITETNVPHEENLSYLGNGRNEADMIYQFALPPLVLHSLLTHSSEAFQTWVKGIDRVSDTATYFNFLSSHDGIGLRPVERILSESERGFLVENTLKRGGRVSYKENTDGSKSVYEMNIVYNDALLGEEEDTDGKKTAKVLASMGILLSMVGMPAIYYHSLFGSHNDEAGMQQSGINRRINREKLDSKALKQALREDPYQKGVFEGIRHLISIRKKHNAFSPYAGQRAVFLDKRVISYVRHNEGSGEEILVLVNTGLQRVTVNTGCIGVDLLTGNKLDTSVSMEGYQVIWNQIRS